MKKIISFFVAVTLVLAIGLLVISINAASVSEAKIVTSSIEVTAGGVAYVDISLTSNPGLTYLKLKVSYDTNVLTLFGIQNGDIISDLTRGNSYVWSAVSATRKTGRLATLIFSVSESIPVGTYPITITCVEASNDEADVSTSIQNGSVVMACVHEMETVSYQEPKCNAAGSRVLKCEKCGHSQTINFDMVDCIAENEADCENNAKCKYCGKILERAYGHNYRTQVIDPTTTEEGYTLYTCMRCGDSYEDDFLPPIKEHQHHYVVYQVVAATCKTDGYTIYKCSDDSCGDTYQDNIVAAKGHNYSSQVIAPTCKVTGYTQYTCGTCGDSYKSNYISPIDHNYVNGICTMCGDDNGSGGTSQNVDIEVYNNANYFSSIGKFSLGTFMRSHGDTIPQSIPFYLYKDSPNNVVFYTNSIPSNYVGTGQGNASYIDVQTGSYELYYVAAPVENDVNPYNNYNLVIVANAEMSATECHYTHDYDAVYVNNGVHKLRCKNCDFEITAECWYPDDCGDKCVICGADKAPNTSIPVSGISLSQTTATVKVDEKLWLDAIIQPGNATNQILDWESSDESIVKVRWEPSGTSGCIIGVSEGTATITVTTRDGGKRATCQVTVQANAVDPNAPTISIDNVTSSAGKTVSINIALKNNPGIASMKLKVAYDTSVLTLQSVEYNNAMGGQFQQPQTMKSPVTLNWYNGGANTVGDYTYATLVFVVNEGAQAGTSNITVTYDPDDVYNINYTNIHFAVQNGQVTIVDHMPGDISGDGKVNNKDLSLLFQYLSDWNVTVNEAALDVNGDGKVNNKDLSLLFQYLSDWDVEIH